MRLVYADPPYLGCCGLYDHNHGNDGRCWDDIATHEALIHRLRGFHGFVLHASSPSLGQILPLCDEIHEPVQHRVTAWVKPFAAFKANVSVAYAWEPVIIKAARKPEVTGREVMRDWIAEPITMQRGLTGAKPERVCKWAFELMGAHPDDDFHDLFPGSGAVTRAWESWRMQLPYPTTASEAPDRGLAL